ncbi:DUF3552 domain-containing protein, partial [Candidatus Peregrinibacteria bacterium]|nr:DUF3552 domain-containing protein [Candidatus Peregrinibacteria bacterium]
MTTLSLIIGLLVAVGGLTVGYSLARKSKAIPNDLRSAIAEHEQRLATLRTDEAEARANAKEILSEAKLQASQLTAKLEKEEGRLEEKEKALDKKTGELEQGREQLRKAQDEVHALREELSQASQAHRSALLQVAKLTQEEAKTLIQQELEEEFSPHFAAQIALKRQHMEEEAEDHARDLLAQAMQRYAAEVATESTSTIVELPSDDAKGKIIGKEGRNINAFEQATGVDIIIDDTPGVIIISGFDLARRYVAKLALEKLLHDGRIQPARIEEVVTKMKEQVGKMMLEFGKRACEELGITGYPQDLLKIIGRLRFRTSYGQNILKHSVEMANLGRMLAEEMGADPRIVVEGCLLHDLGKALDHEVTGTHVEIGVEICKRFKVRPEVIHCVAAHHEDIPIATPEAFVVAAADAISGARPG